MFIKDRFPLNPGSVKYRFPLNPGSVKYRFYCNCLHTGLRIVKDDSLLGYVTM
jgi:hypothetical protein